MRLGDKQLDPIYDPVADAINRAYVQGWIDSEIDFVQALGLLSVMADDSAALSELWDIAQKRPMSDDALLLRRDWIEYEFARDQLSRVGIDPQGRRPASCRPVTPPGGKAKKGKKSEKAKRR